MKRAHVTSVNPSLKDECKLYQFLCCAITLRYSLILSCHAKMVCYGPVCRSLNFTGVLLNPLEPPLPPYTPALYKLGYHK